MMLDKPFFIVPNGGKRVSYGTLLERVSDPLDEAIDPVIRHRDTATFFEQLIAGVLRERPLLLLDVGDPIPKAEDGFLAGEMVDKMNAPKIRLSGIDDLTSGLEHCHKTKITLLTSGSTGRPKRVTHTLGTLTRSVRVHQRRHDDVWGLTYHPAHMAGLLVFFQAVMNGNTMVNLNGLSPDALFDVIRDHGITHLSATPTFYRLLPRPDVPLTSVRRVTFGGEMLDSALMTRMSEVFPNAKLLNVYASTEAGALFATRGDHFCIPDAMAGKARFIDGELYLHRSVLGELLEKNEGEWYSTGDLIETIASSSEEERFEFRGRRGQEINVGGNKVDPLEVESIIRSHARVRDCRVFGRPNLILGSILCCDVILDHPIQERALRAALADQLVAFKAPRVWRFVDELEMTRSGKRDSNGND